MDSALDLPGRRRASRRDVVALLFHGLALAAAAGVVALTAHQARWLPLQLGLIAAFTVLSDLAAVEADSTRLRVSGTGLGLVLAATILGAAPAAVIGALAVSVGWLQAREAGHYFRQNLVNFIWFPLLSGLFFHAVVRAAGVDPHSPGYYVLVFPTFVIGLIINFSLAAGYQCHLEGTSLLVKAREALLPVLSAELFSSGLSIAAVFVAVRMGAAGITLVGLVLALFQYLVGELLKSNRRGRELQRLASHDTLTGLYNRDRFHHELDQTIGSTAPGECRFAVMLLDLDRFKEINDTLGHHYGDELLRELGPRLATTLGDQGMVARLGGDEFALLAAADDVEALAARLIACVQEAILVDELSLEVGASIGIARYPEDGEDANTLLRCADVAMYAAKETHAGWKFYASAFDRHSVRKLSVLSDFRRALEHDEIIAYYQPIVAVSDGHVRGAEALVRWEHPALGLLAPGAFVDTIERTGLIGPMTRQVLERAIDQCAQWRRGGQDLSVAVNLSVRNLLDRNLPAEVERLLGTYGVPPQALQLEITESMLMSDPERVLTTVTRLNALGVRLSVDDFGTGYSSLANLRHMPIDELKIDRSFVSPMLQDESDLIIVRSTINLGHDLGLQVIAEGVEDEPTLARLDRLGCDLAQGYHVSRPMPPEQFVSWLRQVSPAPALPAPQKRAA